MELVNHLLTVNLRFHNLLEELDQPGVMGLPRRVELIVQAARATAVEFLQGMGQIQSPRLLDILVQRMTDLQWLYDCLDDKSFWDR